MTTPAAQPLTTPASTPESSYQNPDVFVQSTSEGTIGGNNSANIPVTLLAGQTIRGTLTLSNGTSTGGAELSIRLPDGKVVDLGRQNVNERLG